MKSCKVLFLISEKTIHTAVYVYRMENIDGRLARGGRKRAQILDVAVGMATADGIDGFSLDVLAKASGVPKGSIQTLFKDKLASNKRSSPKPGEM